jgi:hypothetical protein
MPCPSHPPWLVNDPWPHLRVAWQVPAEVDECSNVVNVYFTSRCRRMQSQACTILTVFANTTNMWQSASQTRECRPMLFRSAILSSHCRPVTIRDAQRWTLVGGIIKSRSDCRGNSTQKCVTYLHIKLLYRVEPLQRNDSEISKYTRDVSR